MRISNILMSWDIIVAAIVAVILYFVLPTQIDNDFASTVYGIGITVLSIVFSVYFAALAIIISSGDNDFIHFLEDGGNYTTIISSFRFSLILLFVSLVSSIIMSVITAILGINNIDAQHKFVLSIFSFLFSYSLFATAISSLDAIRYAERRVVFIRKMRSMNMHPANKEENVSPKQRRKL